MILTIIQIDFNSYNFWYEKLSEEYGNFLDSNQLLNWINKNTQTISERTFNDLKKDGVELPAGINPRGGKWIYGIDAILRWYLGVNKQK